MSVASLLLIILKNKMSQFSTSEDESVVVFVQPNVDAINCGSLVLWDLVVDFKAKDI